MHTKINFTEVLHSIFVGFIRNYLQNKTRNTTVELSQITRLIKGGEFCRVEIFSSETNNKYCLAVIIVKSVQLWDEKTGILELLELLMRERETRYCDTNMILNNFH